MDLTRLRVLVAIADEGSVTAAAEALHYAQPSVSHHLAKLEAETGVALVRRVGRGVRLTEAGELLVDRAREILGRVEAVRAELSAHAGLRAGRVRLAAFPSALATLVPHAAAQLAADHPGVELALTEAEPERALTALRHGEVDLALVFDHPDTPDQPRGTTLHPLLREPLYLITRKSDRTGRTPADHADRRWIAGCPRCRAHLIATCERAGFTPEVDFETDDHVAVQALVAAGLGVSTLPGLALLAHRNPAVRATRLPDDHRRVCVATHGAPPLPGPAQALLDALLTAPPAPKWPR
ncbi:LysR family transcriptional regulator [Actinosynnema pretiosum]|uniref:LysR family transcriptional regulator n=1 Tax=Actinosynnema pretiosum TaxID=42197 RepID=A0A290Z9V2_9PSEU|nr:LysR family transcriptional regulator [Actinosynnema pretiosum]ATE55810.1 LysR family transcriptional regulator [Actinosynnema pretiosum]